MNAFSQIIIIGYGVVTRRVLSYINEHSGEHEYSVVYIEHEVYPFNATKKYAESNNIEHFTIEDKISLTNFFVERASKYKLLIVSASNNYLFPKQLVENRDITIVNFHNALLPSLPGRNAPSWAIYENYKKTGITWHYVTSGIDDGDIIVQKECFLNDDIKAYELVAIQMELAGEAFEENFEDILARTIKATKQNICENRRVYKSKEIPADGKFDIKDNVENIYRLLRSMDYGKNGIFPLPTTVYNEQLICIKRYKKAGIKDKCDSNNRLYLPFDTENALMLKYEIIS